MEQDDYFFGSDEDCIYIKATPEERLDYIGKGLDNLDRDFRKLKEEELLIMARNIFILNKDIKEIKTDIRYIIQMQADDYMDLHRKLEREKQKRITQQQKLQKQINELKETINELKEKIKE